MSGEIEACTFAMAALEDAYRAVFAAARPGMTADEVDAILRKRLAAHGAELPAQRSSPFVVHESGVPPKLRLNRVPLRGGALWAMDTTICRQGRCADIGRYGWFGALPAAVGEAHQRVLDRQDAIAAEVRPRRPMRDIFDALPPELPFEIHRIGARGNMLPMAGNATTGVTEAMARSDERGLVFEPGHVICIEIWAGMDGGIEDMYAVEPDGVRRISSLSREIRQIGE